MAILFLCIFMSTCTLPSPLKVFDMYQGYAQHHGWSFDILEHMTSEIGQWTQTLVIIACLMGQFTQSIINRFHFSPLFCWGGDVVVIDILKKKKKVK